jgi:hypothetical protein
MEAVSGVNSLFATQLQSGKLNFVELTVVALNRFRRFLSLFHDRNSLGYVDV